MKFYAWLIDFIDFRENCPTGVIPEWMQKVTQHNGIIQCSFIFSWKFSRDETVNFNIIRPVVVRKFFKQKNNQKMKQSSAVQNCISSLCSAALEISSKSSPTLWQLYSAVFHSLVPLEVNGKKSSDLHAKINLKNVWKTFWKTFEKLFEKRLKNFLKNVWKTFWKTFWSRKFQDFRI